MIRERVEIAPRANEGPAGDAPPRTAASTQDIVRGSGWPGGVRGRGTLRISGGLTLWGGQGSDVAVTFKMSSGAEHALAQPAFSHNLRRCGSTGTDQSDGRRSFSFSEYVLQLASDERIDSLVVAGPGVRRSMRESVDPPRTYFGNQWRGDVPVRGCTYDYSRGMNASAACDCVEQNGGQLDGEARLYWAFEADPAEKFVVTASQDTVDYIGEGRNYYVTRLTAEAVYADGTPAPLDKNTPVTWSSTPTPYGSLQILASRWPNREQGRGTTWTTAYQRGDVIRFTADGVHADSVWTGGPPVCDTPVSVRANADGISGETTVVIRGTSTATEIEELVVTVSPDVLAPGERAVVSAQAVTEDGCDTLDLSPETPMDVVLSEDVGELVYNGERGPMLTVPYGALRSGEVEFEATTPGGTCGKAWVGVFGGGVSGDVPIDVTTSSGSTTNDGAHAPQTVPRHLDTLISGEAESSVSGSSGVNDDTPVCGGAPNWLAIRLARAVEVDNHLLLDVSCSQIAEWADIGSHEPPQVVRDRLVEVVELQPVGYPGSSIYYESSARFRVQSLTDADGGIINMDYYPVRVSLPDGLDHEAFFESMRSDLGEIIDFQYGRFDYYRSSVHTDEEGRWVSGPVVGSLLRFDVPPFPPGGWNNTINPDDLAVSASEYIYGKMWRFVTVKTPQTGTHPVSGTREFGIDINDDGSFTIYTRGVDRVEGFLRNFIDETVFGGGHNMWSDFQQKIASRVTDAGGVATVESPVVSRPRWSEVRAYFNGEIDFPELMNRLGCA